MSKAAKNSQKKADYEILFLDSPEYFSVVNARMFQEGLFVRFVQFEGHNYAGDMWFPISNIHRIRRYERQDPSPIESIT